MEWWNPTPFSYDLGSQVCQSLRVGQLLPKDRQYSVHFNQYHRSIPCNKHISLEDAWWATDTVEWIINVGPK